MNEICIEDRRCLFLRYDHQVRATKIAQYSFFKFFNILLSSISCSSPTSHPTVLCISDRTGSIDAYHLIWTKEKLKRQWAEKKKPAKQLEQWIINAYMHTRIHILVRWTLIILYLCFCFNFFYHLCVISSLSSVLFFLPFCLFFSVSCFIS